MRVVLPFKLVGQKLVKGRDFPKSVADGSKDSIVIKVGGIPDGCIAKGYFKLSWENNTTYDLTFNGDELVVDEHIVTLPVYAKNKYIDYKFSFSVAIWEGDVERLTTNPVEIVVEKSNYTDETTNTPDIPESQYNALAKNVAMVTELANDLNEDVADHGRRLTELEQNGGGESGVIVSTPTYPYAVGDADGHVVAYIDIDENGEPIVDYVGKGEQPAAKPLKQNGNYDAEINMFICYGQSWSVGYDAYPAITTSPRYDNLMLDTGIRNANIDDMSAVATSFVPAVESDIKEKIEGYERTLGETPVTAQMHIVKQLMESEDGLTVNDLSYQLLGTAPGMGSKTLAQLSKGTDYYNRLIAQVQQAYDIAMAMGKRLVVQAFSWSQGSIGAGLTGTYAENLEKLRFDIDTDVKAITGQTQDVKCITWQSFVFNPSVTAKDTYAKYVGAAETYPNIICAGATYQLDNIRDANLHLTAEHNDLMGALFGVAYKRTIIDGEKFEPLKPIGASKSGKILYIKFNVPQRPLVIDTESFDEVPNKGFKLYATDGTEKTIAEVAVISPDTVKIVCDENVVSTDRLVYVPNLINEIYAGDEQIKFHWTSDCRGNLRDSQGDYIQYKSGNIDDTHSVLPLHNWCVIFDKTVAELEG